VLVQLQRRLIYFPSPPQLPRAEAVVAGAREVTLRTVDGLALGVWLVEAGERDRGVAVLVANGNAGNRSLRAPLARALASAGLAVLLFDYRGYGGNPGRPSERGLARDVRAALRFLIEEGRGSPGAPPLLRREPRLGGGHRARDRAPAGPGFYFARRSSTSPRWDGSTIHSCPSGHCFRTATRSPSISRA
jgi:fermentation-respiration switch protein FrsA (DUF1100 family)